MESLPHQSKSDSSSTSNRHGDALRSKSLQLSVRGQATAFDISPGNELLCVASPGCLTFFHLNGLGSPRHVIHYEQPKQVRAIRYQKTGNLAALRAGIISLWDPTNSLRPLTGLLQSSGQSIVDMQWSNFNHNLLGAAFQAAPNSGSGIGILAWDVRSPGAPSQYISLQGRSCVGVEWGPNVGSSFLVGACVDFKRVLLYDTRMVGSDKIEPWTSIEPKGGIHHYCWSKWNDENLLVVSTNSGAVEWWSVGKSGAASGCKRMGAVRPTQVDGPCTLLPAPVGKAVVTCYPRFVEAYPAQQTNQPITGVDPSELVGVKLPSVRRSYNQVLTLQGFPADRLPLESLFSPFSSSSSSPATGNNSSRISSGEEFGEGPISSLATCAQRLLGLRWGTPGRLVPPFHGGFEMLMLTESATLHAVKVPLDAVKKCCWAVETGLPSNNPAFSFGLKKEDTPQLVVENRPMNNFLDVNALKKGPRFVPGGGGDRIGSLSATSEGLGRADNFTEANRGIDRFWVQMQSAVLSLEEAISLGQFKGVALGRIDQYARQIHIEMSRSACGDPGIDSDDTISLIISFPPDFPASSAPVFSVEGHLQNDQPVASKSAELLEMELAQLAKSLLSSKARATTMLFNESFESSFTASFLVDVVHCFKNRVLQLWRTTSVEKEADPGDAAREALAADGFTLIIDDRDGEGIGQETISVVDGTFRFSNDSRIPFPRSSGAVFSPLGYLACYGGCELELNKISKSMKIDTNAATSTYATYLSTVKSGMKAGTQISSQDGFPFLQHVTRSLDSSSQSRTESVDGSTGGDDEGTGSDGCYMESSEEELSTGDQTPKGHEVFARVGAYSAAREKLKPPQTGQSNAPPSAAVLPFGQVVQSMAIIPNSPSPPLGVVPGVPTGVGFMASTMNPNTIDKSFSAKDIGDSSFFVASRCPNAVESTVVPDLSNSSKFHLSDTIGSSEITTSKVAQIDFYFVVDLLPLWLANNYLLGAFDSLNPDTRSWSCNVASCISNAKVVASLLLSLAHETPAMALIPCVEITLLRTIEQIWRLLAVSLDMYHKNADSVISKAVNVDIMSNWANSALGRPLLSRLVGHLLNINSSNLSSSENVPLLKCFNRNDRLCHLSQFSIQTLATVICAAGGTRRLHELISEELRIKLSPTILDSILNIYSELLALWRMPVQSLQVSKYCSPRSECSEHPVGRGADVDTFNIGWKCSRCGQYTKTKMRMIATDINNCLCSHCGFLPSRCSLCQLPVRDSGSYCLQCGHGGHSDHMAEWFSVRMECPTGCGCNCTEICSTRIHGTRSGFGHDFGESLSISSGSEDPGDSNDVDSGSSSERDRHSEDSDSSREIDYPGYSEQSNAEIINSQSAPALQEIALGEPASSTMTRPALDHVQDAYTYHHASDEYDSDEYDFSNSSSFRMYL